MAKKKWDYQFKVLLLGDSAVGKTSIVQKYAGNPFETTYYPTIGRNST
jgi:Ras-related protein Rab-1A